MAPIAFSSSSSDESLQQPGQQQVAAHKPVAWIGQVSCVQKDNAKSKGLLRESLFSTYKLGHEIIIIMIIHITIELMK